MDPDEVRGLQIHFLTGNKVIVCVYMHTPNPVLLSSPQPFPLVPRCFNLIPFAKYIF